MTAVETKRRRRRSPLRLVGRVLAWMLLLVVVAGAAVPVYGVVTKEYRLLPVLSGSMEPGFYRGDLAWVEPRPAEELAVGDVLVFTSPTRGSTPGRRVIHRVIELVDPERVRDDQTVTDAIYVRTQGDNNPDADPWIAAITDDTVQVQTGVVPDLGRPLLFVQEGGARALPLVAAAALMGMWGVSLIRGGTEPSSAANQSPAEGSTAPTHARPRRPRPLVAPVRPLRAAPARAPRRRWPIVVVASLIGATAVAGAVAAALVDDESTSTAASTGAVVLELGPTTLGVTVDDLLPGEAAVRIVDLRNTGSLDLSAVELVVSGPAGSILDPTNGLQLTVERCATALVLGAGPDGRPAATCGTSLIAVVPERPALGTMDLDLAALTVDRPQQTDHLRIVLRLPETASPVLAGAGARVELTFTGHQRASVNR